MEQKRTEIIEDGDLFFFYRPRLDAEQVRGQKDVQHLYMVLAPRRPHRLYRMFVIGRKKLPETAEGKSSRGHRSWALNTLTSTDVEDIRRDLLGKEYETETRGERHAGAARPVGEGKYQLVRHGDHTELAFVLELPKEPGPAQEEFEIKKEASYVISVKNPEVSVPGFPAPKEPPAYGAALKAKFGHRRWIDADDPALLDQEHAQILLLGSHEGAAVKEELGVEIDVEDKALKTADVFRELRQRREGEAVKPLLTGEFPASERAAPGEEVERLPPERAPGKGGKGGGKARGRR